MLVERPLFWFEYEMIYWEHRFWLCEVCVYWNGLREIVEMVEVKGSDDGYFSEN